MKLYHILNRGVEKRNIFQDNQDHARFVHNLFEFNNQKPAGNAYRRFYNSHSIQVQTPMMDLVGPSFTQKGERLVDIHGWVLMKNHYHLLISENSERALSAFLMKLNVGYAKYFNKKYTRSGTLFQGRTKKVLINSDAHFLHILHYIHLNPLDFLANARDWRARRISNGAKALMYLDEYRWSSYQDYCRKKNFPSILTKDLFEDVFPDYRKEIRSYIRDIDTSAISGLTLE